MVMELRGEEVFHLNVLHYDAANCGATTSTGTTGDAGARRSGRQTDAARRGAQGVRLLDRRSPVERSGVRCDGTAGVNLALGTWHWGPYPILDYVDLVNVQGKKNFSTDNEVAYLERDLGVVVEVIL